MKAFAPPPLASVTRYTPAPSYAIDRHTEIARGVYWLREEPWRANSIIPHATNMTLSALALAVARHLGMREDRRRTPLLKLKAALADAGFCEAWGEYRESLKMEG